MILFTLMLMTILIPMVGLAIDGTKAFIIKAKLSTAVDGGAIAAANMLSAGANAADQAASAAATGKQFVKANFPAGTWGSQLQAGQPSICVDNGDGSDPCGLGTAGQVGAYKVRNVVISARADVPLWFLRIFGLSSTSVAASGRASRRDSRVVLVIDRSTSMGNKIDDVKLHAQEFVDRFAPNRDEVGLVVFGGSAIVAYPARDATKDPTDPASFSPPDKNFYPKVRNLIGQIKSTSNTGMAEALYLAYQTLKADAATNPEVQYKMNAIVLFTDGLPNGITAQFNRTGENWVSSSSCNYRANSAAFPSSTAMVGWFAQWNGFKDDTDGARGLLQPMMITPYQGYTGRGDDIDKWMSGKDYPNDDEKVTSMAQGCNCAKTDASGNPTRKLAPDLAKLPTHDLYWNSTTRVGWNGLNPGTGDDSMYKNSYIYQNFGKRSQNINAANNSYQVGLASWNATADQAWKIWNDKYYDKNDAVAPIKTDTHPISPVIFTIGYYNGAGAEAPDQTLMKIISNTEDSPVSVAPDKIHGKMYYTTSTSQVGNAFAEIASEILRIAQ
ncbi:MAG: VWA domain-containing protein [Acidobacteriota bacterium]